MRIYDYAEIDQPQLARMWNKRQRGYRAMGYQIKLMKALVYGMSKPENKIGRYYKFAEFAKRDGPMWAVNYRKLRITQTMKLGC